MKPINKFVEKVYLRVLPAPQRGALLHKMARERFYRFMRSRLGDFVVEVDPGPVGDSEIIMRTAVLSKGEATKKVDADHYFRSGYGLMLSWLKHLDRNGFNLRTARAMMELGCGSARLIRHLRCIDGIRLVGSDVMPEFIDWCKQNVSGIEFYRNDLQPPLTFAQDNTFDLVFAQSVFTHIPLDVQGAWIKELHRVIRPGGYLACSVLGRFHQEQMLRKEDREVLKQQGHLTLDANSAQASLSTQLIGSWDVFQTRAEVLQVFGSVFQVRDYIAGELDLLILQKPAAPYSQNGHH
jgi:SAM-dependent methyltransferase